MVKGCMIHTWLIYTLSKKVRGHKNASDIRQNVKHVNVLFILIPNLKETNCLINKRSNHLNGGKYVLKSCKWSYTEQAIDEQICKLKNGNICNFSLVPVSIQMVIINQIFQVRYQNKEDIHLLPMISFSLANIKHFWKNLTFRSVQELFFLSVY